MICKYSPCVTWDSGIFQSWQEFNLFEVFRKYSWSMIAVLEKNKTLILSSLLLQQSLSYTATLSYNLYPWIQTISRANLFQYKKITNYIVAYFGLQGTVAGFGVTDLWLGSPGWCWPPHGLLPSLPPRRSGRHCSGQTRSSRTGRSWGTLVQTHQVHDTLHWVPLVQ